MMSIAEIAIVYGRRNAVRTSAIIPLPRLWIILFLVRFCEKPRALRMGSGCIPIVVLSQPRDSAETTINFKLFPHPVRPEAQNLRREVNDGGRLRRKQQMSPLIPCGDAAGVQPEANSEAFLTS